MIRADYYGVSAIPDTYFDGIDNILGGWPGVYDDMEQIVINHLDDDPYVAIDLSGSSIGPLNRLGRSDGTVQTRITLEQDVPWQDVKIVTVVYED